MSVFLLHSLCLIILSILSPASLSISLPFAPFYLCPLFTIIVCKTHIRICNHPFRTNLHLFHGVSLVYRTMFVPTMPLLLPPGLRQSGRFQLPVDFSHPERELFLWALLLNRRQLAMLFWKLGQDHIGASTHHSHNF